MRWHGDAAGARSGAAAFPPLFGVRRALACPPLQRIDFAARNGARLCLHHTSGGTRGPVLLSPGTAMTALSYCIDTVAQNLVEYLVAEGFDVWLFDWRTSPLLGAHAQPYTLDDVARFDWPAAVDEVRRRSGQAQVGVLAHCLSAPSCFRCCAAISRRGRSAPSSPARWRSIFASPRRARRSSGFTSTGCGRGGR